MVAPADSYCTSYGVWDHRSYFLRVTRQCIVPPEMQFSPLREKYILWLWHGSSSWLDHCEAQERPGNCQVLLKVGRVLPLTPLGHPELLLFGRGPQHFHHFGAWEEFLCKASFPKLPLSTWIDSYVPGSRPGAGAAKTWSLLLDTYRLERETDILVTDALAWRFNGRNS